MSTTYEHRGITITFDDKAAKFSCVLGGKRARTGSLDSLKKKIDAHVAIDFKPFDCITDYQHNNIRRGRAVALNKTTNRWYRNGVVFQIEGAAGVRERGSVHPDTPECMALIEHAIAVRARNEAEIKRLNEEITAAEAEIPVIEAGAQQ